MGRRRGGKWTVLVLALFGAAVIGAGYRVATNLNEEAAPSERADELAFALGRDDRTGGTPPPTASAEPLTTEELARRFRDAVYRVDTEGCGFEGGGTAFAVADHLLITNWHVVVTDTTPVVVAQDGTRLDAEVLGWSQQQDIAVLAVKESLTTRLRWAETERLVEGQEITVMGYPVVGTDPEATEVDTSFSVTAGRVVSFVVENGIRVGLRTDASADSGNSGGPALTDRGEVAGVVTALDFGNTRVLGLATTRAGLGGVLDTIATGSGGLEADCTEGGVSDDPHETPMYEEYGENHTRYGDDAVLDALHDRCRDADIDSCVRLVNGSPVGSEYEVFGAGCGAGAPSKDCVGQLYGAALAQADRDRELTVGSCAVDGHGTDVMVTIPCEQLHEVEVMATVAATEGSLENEDVEYAVLDACLEQFEPYVGVDYWSSELEYGFIIPATFGPTDRNLQCVVYDPAQPTTGSLRSADR